MTLLEEVESALDAHGVRPRQVVWVGAHDGSLHLSWDEWAMLAAQVKPDAGQVVPDLVVVGKYWWLSRGEGDFGWEFHRRPTRPFPKIPSPYTRFVNRTGKCMTLRQLNRAADE